MLKMKDNFLGYEKSETFAFETSSLVKICNFFLQKMCACDTGSFFFRYNQGVRNHEFFMLVRVRI